MAQGHGMLMAKFDVASAYRNEAFHPDDPPLPGMRWHGLYFVNMVLSFGLRLALFTFTSIVDLVEWMLVESCGVDFLRHYLDDFFTLGKPVYLPLFAFATGKAFSFVLTN